MVKTYNGPPKAWEENLGQEFLWEIRALKNTYIYEEFRKPNTFLEKN